MSAHGSGIGCWRIDSGLYAENQDGARSTKPLALGGSTPHKVRGTKYDDFTTWVG